LVTNLAEDVEPGMGRPTYADPRQGTVSKPVGP
jgi:hypothetical protein